MNYENSPQTTANQTSSEDQESELSREQLDTLVDKIMQKLKFEIELQIEREGKLR